MMKGTDRLRKFPAAGCVPATSATCVQITVQSVRYLHSKSKENCSATVAINHKTLNQYARRIAHHHAGIQSEKWNRISSSVLGSHLARLEFSISKNLCNLRIASTSTRET